MILKRKHLLTLATSLMIVAFASLAMGAELLKDSPISVKPYGYIKLDAAYDTQRTSAGNLMFYVLPEGVDGKDNEFNMTARETRLGFDLAGPDASEFKTTGKIEMDFYGGGVENSANPRIRLAYVDLANDNGFSVRAGQDWETFITVIPRIVNFSYLADQGALGLRRAQLRATQIFNVGTDSTITAKAALARTIGQDLDGAGVDDGADSGVPTIQGNLIYGTKIFTEKDSKISISGHWGRETVDTFLTAAPGTTAAVVDDDSEDYDTYSIIGSLFLPLIETLTLQGTVWTGQNLDNVFGGIGQGVNTTLGEEIEAQGGFVQLLWDCTDKLNWNVGFGMDNPKDSDLNSGNRSNNTMVFTSLFYKVTSAVTAAVEYSHIKTDYKNADDAVNNRVQGAVIYKF